MNMAGPDSWPVTSFRKGTGSAVTLSLGESVVG